MSPSRELHVQIESFIFWDLPWIWIFKFNTVQRFVFFKCAIYSGKFHLLRVQGETYFSIHFKLLWIKCIRKILTGAIATHNLCVCVCVCVYVCVFTGGTLCILFVICEKWKFCLLESCTLGHWYRIVWSLLHHRLENECCKC